MSSNAQVNLLKYILITTIALMLSYVGIKIGAFWGSYTIKGTSNETQNGISIGVWDYFDPNDAYIDPTNPNESLLKKPLGALDYIKGGTYQEGDIIYYNGKLYVYHNNTNTQGTPEQAWADFSGLASHLPTYKSYATGDVIIYTYMNQSYVFEAGSASYLDDFTKIVTQVGWLPLRNIVYDYIPGGNYDGFVNPAGYVKYNNQFYQYLWGNTLPTSNGWILYNQTYHSTQTYQVGDIVVLNGNMYQAVNQVRANTYSPNLHQKDAWNLIYGDAYHSFNTYQAGDFVKYNGVYFYAVSGGDFNHKYPGESINAWNRADTFYYKHTNTYSIGDIVLYEDVLYECVEPIIQQTKIPGKSTAWVAI